MDSTQLALRVGELLRAQGLTLALAESCTGGLVADLITDVPGSSEYFVGGIVAYSNDVKARLLGVAWDTLQQHGAVSAPCAAEMAQGARRQMQADVAVSVTGIAGPGGEMAGKPVGLTYFHLSAPQAEIGRQAVWSGDRRANKRRSAQTALSLLADYLHGQAG